MYTLIRRVCFSRKASCFCCCCCGRRRCCCLSSATTLSRSHRVPRSQRPWMMATEMSSVSRTLSSAASTASPVGAAASVSDAASGSQLPAPEASDETAAAVQATLAGVVSAAVSAGVTAQAAAATTNGFAADVHNDVGPGGGPAVCAKDVSAAAASASAAVVSESVQLSRIAPPPAVASGSSPPAPAAWGGDGDEQVIQRQQQKDQQTKVAKVCPTHGEKRKAEPSSSPKAGARLFDDNALRADVLDLKRIRRGAKELRPGFAEDRYDETTYYFENGLRKVYPYEFSYTTFTKGRWIGRQLLDVFATEFRAQSLDYYERAVTNGRLLVNNEKVRLDYRLRDNDLLVNKVHRHEVPVLGCKLKIIHEDDDMLVVDKPPSVPVHPCGRYRHNSIVFLLAKELGQRNVHTIHRLDRLTSGVLMFAKSISKSQFMSTQIREHAVDKEYLCRVEGEFPDTGDVEVTEPIEVFSHKIGVCGVSRTGRPCTTTFRRLSYNGKSSVVMARPKQGRMHQIRVHLQYLGHPIVNDPLYNDEIFGKNKAKGGLSEKSTEQLVADMIKHHTLENWLEPLSEEELAERRRLWGAAGRASELGDKVAPAEQDQQQQLQQHADASHDDCFKGYPRSLEHYIDDEFKRTIHAYDPSKMSFYEGCHECHRRYTAPRPSELFIYLHCYRYRGDGWEYTASWPNWAKDDWDVD